MLATQAQSGIRKALPALLIAAICAAIAVSEWVFAYRDPALGIILALVLSLAIYIVLPLTGLGKTFTDCAEALALIPLYILFTSSLPWFLLNQDLILPAVYLAVIAICAWYMYKNRIGLRAVGFKHDKFLQYALLGAAVGLPLGTAEHFVIYWQPDALSFQVTYLLRMLLYMTIFVGIGEELLFRGIVQSKLAAQFGARWGLVIASIMFGVMHLTWRSVPELGFTFAAGLAFGYLYQRTGSLTASIAAHGIGNTVLVAVVPFIV